MRITKSHLLNRLREAITLDEWDSLLNNKPLTISAFNRSVLCELKEAHISDGQNMVEESEVAALWKTIEAYLSEYLKDMPDGWKWIILSSIYLTFIAERPMHPLDKVGIRVVEEDGKVIYQCPLKSADTETACYYCVCQKAST